METKNFVIEVIEGAERKRTFIVRELGLPNQPAIVKAVCDSPEELAQFFDSDKLFK